MKAQEHLNKVFLHFILIINYNMKKQILVVAIIIMKVVMIPVYMFFIYGISEAKAMASLIDPAT